MRLAVVTAVLVAVAGCGADSADEDAARNAVVERAASARRDGEIRCTSDPRRLFGARQRTDVFLCIVRVRGARCDRYRVSRRRGAFAVTAVRRDTDCVLPVG